MIIVSIGSWLSRLFFVGQHIEINIYYFFQWFHHSQKFFVHWYLTARVLSLWCVYNQLRVFVLTFYDVDTLDGTVYGDCACVCVDVVPHQTAYLTNP